MKKILVCLILVLLLWSGKSFAQEGSEGIKTWVEEEDASPSVIVYKLKVANGGLTDNGDGTASLASGSVSDAVYGAGWNGNTTTAPSKNAVYDKVETLQPLDADLTAIAALGFTSTAFLKKTAADTWALDTATYLTTVGTGTINELTYWSGANTLGTLAVATYPSLTELSYVKGVTSAIQTQIGLKAPLISPSFTTPTLGVASATSLATSAATPLLLTNGQLVNIALTSQTVGATTLTIPDFASVVDEFTFKTKAQTMSNKTFVAPALGTPASGVMTNVTGLTEAGQTLANNTTNNASTSAHGYLKILDNVATNFMNGQGNWAVPAGSGMQYSDTRYSEVEATRDMTAASGTQAITGAGFTPTKIEIFGCIDTTGTAGWGTGTVAGGNFAFGGYPTGLYFLYATVVIVFPITVSADQHATVSTWDSDGVTLSWTKTGAPTGTASFTVRFYR